MRISGLQSLYGNYYGTSKISRSSQMQQLREIMQNVQNVSRSSASNRSTYTRSMDRTDTEFLKNYNKSMSELMTGANALRSMNNSGLWNKTTVKSSDKTVLNAVQNYRMSAKDSYAVNVKQLATKQTNTSIGLQKNSLAQKDAAFSISNGKGSFSFRISAKDQDGNFKTNTQMLKEMADAVNRKGIGVKASVTTEGDTSKLTFTSEETGKEKGFQVEGEAAAEYGLNNVTQQAQDAEYTVSKNGREEQTFTSDKNTVTMDYGRMDVTFEKTGEATIQAGQIDTDQIVSAVKDLVEKNNSTISLLEKNADRGYGVQRQLDSMTAASVTDRYMENIGISKGSDGKLTLDETKLKAALENDTAATKELLGGSFGLAQSSFNDAKAGMAQSSASLLNQNSYGSYGSYSGDYNYFSDFTNNFGNSYQMLGMYSRYGVRTMSNLFAMGNFLDMYL